MNNIVTFNQLNECTNDRRFTQRDLINKIQEIVKSYGWDDNLTQSVVNSFVKDGLIETYNELGYEKWLEFIRGCIAVENYERNKIC